MAGAHPATRQRTAPAAGLVPTQHGAWAFLALPVLLGAIAGGWDARLVPVVAGWIVLYPLSWSLTNRLAAPRPARFSRPLRFWAAFAVPLVVVSVLVVPWLVWVGVAYLAPFAVNVGFAKARRERTLVNDLVLIGECVAAVPVVAGVAAGSGSSTPPWSVMTSTSVVLMALVCALTLTGSTLHVKSLIRERQDPRFTTASRMFSLACLPVVLGAAVLAGAGAWLVVPFLFLAFRAWWWHDPSWRPGRIGAVELTALVLVAVFAAPAVR